MSLNRGGISYQNGRHHGHPPRALLDASACHELRRAVSGRLTRPAHTLVPKVQKMPRKRLWVPVVVLAVAVAGFEGYGAYTRSTPVDYARGGGDFASLPT